MKRKVFVLLILYFVLLWFATMVKANNALMNQAIQISLKGEIDEAQKIFQQD